MIFRYAAGRKDFLHILLAHGQRLRDLGFLVQLNALTHLIVDSLDHIHAAFVIQRCAQQCLKGLFLLRRRFGIGVLNTALTNSSWLSLTLWV